jgi:hypothetical protein
MPFDEYLKVQGYSYSFLKSNIKGVVKYFEQTEKIQIGKLVDAILTDPTKADMSDPNYNACREIVYKLKSLFGDVIQLCEAQVSYCAKVSYRGLSIYSKGRLDFLLKNVCVIDLKVTSEKNVDALIEYMGYQNQLWHYAKMAQVKKAYLLIYSRPLKQVIVKTIDVTSDSNTFFENKIIDFGRVPELINN